MALSAPALNSTGLYQRSLPTDKSLFPISHGLLSWTTFQGSSSSSSSYVLPLANSTLQPEKVINDLPWNFTNAPDGKLAMKIHFKAGSYKLSAVGTPPGGVSFYAPGPPTVNLENAKEATLGYSIFFPNGYDFVKGGKLPGLYGGDSQNISFSCSGGRRDQGCFSARLMWREKGAGELYTYLPPVNLTDGEQPNQKICNLPGSVCDDNFGDSIGRGNFHYNTGSWSTVAQRVKLNDAGQANGELQVYVDGKSVVNVTGLILRDNDQGRIRGIQVQSFFGGNTSDWATPNDQDLYFSDFSVAIIEDLDGTSTNSIANKSGSTGMRWNSKPGWLFVIGWITASVLSVC